MKLKAPEYDKIMFILRRLDGDAAKLFANTIARPTKTLFQRCVPSFQTFTATMQFREKRYGQRLPHQDAPKVFMGNQGPQACLAWHQ